MGKADVQAAPMRIEDFFDEEATPGALEEGLETHEVRRQLSGGHSLALTLLPLAVLILKPA
jgi:hypothetical protein